MDIWDQTANPSRLSQLPAAAALDSTAKHRQRRERSHAGGPGALGRAQEGLGWHGGHDRGHDTDSGAPESGGLRRGGLAAAQTCSGEQLHRRQGTTREIKGMVELLPSRGNFGAPEQRRGTKEALGRQRRSFGYTRRRPVSVDRAKQRCWGQTIESPALLAKRLSSQRQQTRQM
jgi:hypothetical protein